MELLAIIILIIISASLSSAIPLNFSSADYCYTSDGLIYPISDIKQAQNYCTSIDSRTRLLEIYDQYGWDFINNSLTSVPASTRILLNTIGDDYPVWTTILGNPLQADYIVKNDVSMYFIYLSKSSGSLAVYGGDNTANRPYICMYTGPCQPPPTGYNISNNCYTIQTTQVTWFEAETSCYNNNNNNNNNNNGHLASFENVPFASLMTSDLAVAMTTTDEYWIGVTKFDYRWLSSNTTMYFSMWDAGYPLYDPNFPNLNYFVHFQVGSSQNKWRELPVSSPSNSFQVICMKDVLKTSTQMSTEISTIGSSTQTLSSETTTTTTETSSLTTSTSTISTSTLSTTTTAIISTNTLSTTTQLKLSTDTFTSTQTNDVTSNTPTSDFNNNICIVIIFLVIIYLIFAIALSAGLSYYVYG